LNRYYSQTKIDYDSIGLFLEGDLQIAPTKYTEKATDYQCINFTKGRSTTRWELHEQVEN